MKLRNIFGVLLLLSAIAFGQGIRFDLPNVLTTTTLPSIGGNKQFIIVVGFPAISLCAHPANAVPCTNTITTYTDVTLGTPCPTNQQIVLQGTSTCTNTGDAQGNAGYWLTAGTYDYTITNSAGQSFGPFYITPGQNSTFSTLTVTGNGSIGGTLGVTGQVNGTTGVFTVSLTAPNILTGADCGVAVGACANTVLAKPYIVTGKMPMTAGSASATGISPAFANSNFRVTCTDQTNTGNGCTCSPASTTIISCLGTGTDTVLYVAVGTQ